MNISTQLELYDTPQLRELYREARNTAIVLMGHEMTKDIFDSQVKAVVFESNAKPSPRDFVKIALAIKEEAELRDLFENQEMDYF